MLHYLYTTYLAKDKPLRHYMQHLLVAAVGYTMTISLSHMTFSFSSILTYLICTYIIDLDGFMSLFFSARSVPEGILIRKDIREFDLESAAIHATRFHKKFNRLLLHNVIGLIVLCMALGIAIYYVRTTLLLATSAILFHFLFDIWDDYYQLGHVNNWLWPIRKITRAVR